MKISLALTALILVLGGAWWLRDHQRLEVLREEQREVEVKARAAGIEVPDDEAGSGPRITRRPRESRDEEMRQTSAKIIAMLKEMQQAQKDGGAAGLGMQERGVALMEMMMDLSPAQLKVLLSELKSDPDLDDQTRQGVTGFAIMMLAESNPQAALALFTEAAELFEGGRGGSHVVRNALAKWAKEDPMAALEWVRKNAEKHPDVVTDDTKRGIIEGAALQDPRLAFQLLGELELKDPAEMAGSVARAARTPEGRTATLKALREHLATMTDGEAKQRMEGSVMRTLANSLRNQNFDASAEWLADAGLEPREKVALASGLNYHTTKEESGEWIGWMAKELPPEQVGEKVRNIVGQWTREDFQAAGNWLAQAPDDAAKAPAVRSFAETVASYEPETAEQWALTLPPGKDREETLRSIYTRWPQGDDATKAAFAERYGIK